MTLLIKVEVTRVISVEDEFRVKFEEIEGGKVGHVCPGEPNTPKRAFGSYMMVAVSDNEERSAGNLAISSS